MKYQSALIASMLFATQSICYAQQVEKNGLPCVAEICLGDGVAELSKVHWDRAKNPMSNPQRPLYTSARKLEEYEMKSPRTMFPGDLGHAAPYLNDHIFDSEALASLSRVTAACSNGGYLDGTYTTDSGNPTRVRIELLPNMSDTTRQQWTVTFIHRTFPKAISKEQKNEVSAQLTERYKEFNKGNLYIPEFGEGTFRISKIINSFGFTLNLFTGIGGEVANRLKRHPACGGSEKVKID